MRSGGRNGASVLGHRRDQHLRAGHHCADPGLRALTDRNLDLCTRGRDRARCRLRGMRRCRQPATFHCVSWFNSHAQTCSNHPDEFGRCNAHGVRHRRSPCDPLARMGHRNFTPGGLLVVEECVGERPSIRLRSTSSCGLSASSRASWRCRHHCHYRCLPSTSDRSSSRPGLPHRGCWMHLDHWLQRESCRRLHQRRRLHPHHRLERPLLRLTRI